MSKSLAKIPGTTVDDKEIAKEISPPASGVESTPDDDTANLDSEPALAGEEEDEGLDKADIYGDVSVEHLDVDSDEDDTPTDDIPLEKVDFKSTSELVKYMMKMPVSDVKQENGTWVEFPTYSLYKKTIANNTIPR